MRVLLSFYDQFAQVVVFQSLDKWWYNIGVSRIQTRFLGRGFYTHDKVYFINDAQRRCISCYTTATQNIKHITTQDYMPATKYIQTPDNRLYLLSEDSLWQV